MGMKKITPEEKLLNLIRKSQASPVLSVPPAPLVRGEPAAGSSPAAGNKLSKGRVLFFFSCVLCVLLAFGIYSGILQKYGPSLKKLSAPSGTEPSASVNRPVESTSSHEADTVKSSVPKSLQPDTLVRIPPPSGYVLTGVIIGEPLSAMVRNTETNEILTLEIGDTLLEYTLTRIEKGKVTFEGAGNTFTMTL